MTNAMIGSLADREQTVRTPPRPLVRTFWVAQRAIYRLSKGRIGLATPEAGQKFGMLSLETVGCRSGKARAAIVGYYEDGANLVTLAMNGWGKAEPAWWLNLQANPEATVQLVDGSRAVRARVSTGDERERLWTKFGEYPGWGDDLDALAARRPGQTAVVVLEPRLVAEEADRADVQDHVSSASRTRDGRSAATATQRTGRSRRLRPRHFWLLPGIGLALFANTQASQLGVGLAPLLVFGIVPDLPRLVGIRRPAMLALHNAAHHPALALAMLFGLAVTGMSPFAYVGALAWLGHIVVGCGTGDRLKSVGEHGTTGSRAFRLGRLALAPEATRGSSR
jgi:deazaflavin-dependent oxidoreductase (nitroreductase family)